ncbi:MAG: aldo/keto reductase [Pseudomonadota bacterium]
MDRITLTDGVEFSRIVYGMWRLDEDEDNSPAHIQAKIESCLAQGITTMDQADIYGGYMAEELLGNAFRAAPALRDQVEIVTKCDIVAPMGRYSDVPVKYYDTSRAHILASVDHSLRLMGIDTIDLLLIHRPDPMMDACETGAALDEVVKSGKVKSVGVSNFKPWDWTLLQGAMETQLVTNQIEMSLLERSSFTNGDLAFLQERGIPPMAWSPLGGGGLFDSENSSLRSALQKIGDDNGIDEAAVAVAWLLAHPARVIPVMGTNRLDRIATLGQATKLQMDRQTWYELYTIAQGYEVP